ncbi:MAG: ATP-binding protein [Candidatus Contubernalis sp.]|nr:ATP-binding protein [Candidatus Contubernalis sp.]
MNKAGTGLDFKAYKNFFWGKKEKYKDMVEGYSKGWGRVSEEQVTQIFKLIRFISLLFTSVFYLLGPPLSPPFFKLGVIFLVFTAALLSLRIYDRNRDKPKVVGMLVALETMGVGVLLVFTGGLQSPFILYSLNPLVMATAYLPLYLTWVFLGVFLTAAILEDFFLFGRLESVVQVLYQESYLILFIILVTAAMQIFVRLFFSMARQSQQLHQQQQELYTAYQNLSENHHIIQEKLKHISSLYEAVETVSTRKDLKEVINLFAAYAKALTGSEKVVLWIEQDSVKTMEPEQNYIYSVRGRKSYFPEKYWHAALLKAWSKIQDDPEPVTQRVLDPALNISGQLVCMPVKSRSRCYGLLAVLQSGDSQNIDEIMQILGFLADLSAVSIERNLADIFADKLLLIEEQNRIANEIHDGISQNLFSIVYGVDVLSKGEDFTEVSRTRLKEIRNLAATTAKEIRFLIYRLSPRHRGDDTFVKELKTYLESLGNLNQVIIDFNVKGKEEFLKPAIRNAFYRIVKEATGNAVRHGESTKISVDLGMTPFGSNLKISDNGKGFDTSLYNDGYKRNQGLGLVNMRELVMSLHGTLYIDSEHGKGTKVICTVPFTLPVEEESAL